MSSYAPGYKGPMSIGGGPPIMQQQPRPMTQPPMGGFGGQPQPPMGGIGQPMQPMQPMGIAGGGTGMPPPPPRGGGPGFDMRGGQLPTPPNPIQMYEQQQRMQQIMQGVQPPMGQQLGGQPMGGQFPQIAGILGGGGGQFGGQPMQGGFNPQQQFTAQLGGGPSTTVYQQQPQGGFNPQQLAQPQVGQPPMNPMQNMQQGRQQQGGPQGRTMPQAPTTQQIGQEDPRMVAMRRMQQMRFGNR